MTNKRIYPIGYGVRQLHLVKGHLQPQTPWAIFSNDNLLQARREALGAFREAYEAGRDNPTPYSYEVVFIYKVGKMKIKVPIVGNVYVDVVEGLENEALFFKRFYTGGDVAFDTIFMATEVFDTFVTIGKYTYDVRNEGDPLIIKEDSDLILSGMEERLALLHQKIEATPIGNH